MAIIRLFGSVVICFFIYQEAGPVTAVALFGQAVVIELGINHISKQNDLLKALGANIVQLTVNFQGLSELFDGLKQR